MVSEVSSLMCLDVPRNPKGLKHLSDKAEMPGKANTSSHFVLPPTSNVFSHVRCNSDTEVSLLDLLVISDESSRPLEPVQRLDVYDPIQERKGNHESLRV